MFRGQLNRQHQSHYSANLVQGLVLAFSGGGGRGWAKDVAKWVQINKCRYLETSGCMGICVNPCKVPTQYFFTIELGMLLTMDPNFENLNCQMIFGQAPPPLQDDPALKEGCFSTCPSASSRIPCSEES